MNKWRKSIIFKIFLITSGLLVTFASILYAALYFLLPSFYLKYKINSINEGVEALISEVEKSPLEESIMKLDEFSEAYNVELVIHDNEGQIIYLPPSVGRFIQGAPGQFLQKRIILKPPTERGEMAEKLNLHTLKRTIWLEGNPYTLRLVATLQPIDEAANVIFMFTPYILGIILLFTVIGAFFYSRITTKPLIQVNQVAKRMANLDFTQSCTVESEDEIGQLSESLNHLSRNLQKTMSELKRANEQLKDDIQRERELEAKRREFVAIISHELKSPITAVMGQIEAMIHNIGPYKDRDKYLQRSYSIMSEMESLVREVIDLSQLEQMDFAPKLESVNVKDLIEVSLKKFEYFYGTKKIKLDLTLDDMVIHADKKLMDKAIGNVISNAIKYSPNGETIRITLDNKKVCLTVFNSGVQIEEQELAHIFKAFYRIEKSRNRNTGGSGLGLYIVQKILDLHQIEYSLNNRNDGVEFKMTFIEGE